MLSGGIDSNGYANFLSAGIGLAVDLDATPDAVVIAFAAGFGAGGASDLVASISTDQTISSLTASSTCFIYADRNTSTGAITLGHSTLAPEYGYKRPESPAEGQHFFSIPKMVMEVYNGTDWEIKQRVFLGEATTDASSVSEVVTYALRGEYDSGWFSVSANQVHTKNSSLGITPEMQESNGFFRKDDNYNSCNMTFVLLVSGTVSYAYGAELAVTDRNTVKDYMGGAQQNYVSPASAISLGATDVHVTTGQYRLVVKRSF